MLKITKKIEYSLMILKQLGRQDTPMSVSTIALELNIPFDTVSHVLQSLSKSGITESFPGSKGGHKLVSNLGELNLMELAEVIEKKKAVPDCTDQKCKLIGRCSIQTPIIKLQQKIEGLLQSISISDLLEAKL